MHLFMTMLAATASVATSSCLASPLLEQLPQTLRFALVAKHQELDAKAKDNPGGGGNNPFSLDEKVFSVLVRFTYTTSPWPIISRALSATLWVVQSF